MHALIRAIFASFIPLLPVIFQSLKLDWTLPVNFAPQFLSSSAATNLSVNGYDWEPDTGQLLDIESSDYRFGQLDTDHPIFESLTAILHQLRPPSTVALSWGLNLMIIAFLMSVVLLAHLRSTSSLSRRLVGRGRHLEESRFQYGLATTAVLRRVNPPFLSARDEDLYLRLQFPEPITSRRFISSKLDPVASILLSWDEEMATTDTNPVWYQDSHRPRLLSEIMEQSETEDSDVEHTRITRGSWFSEDLRCLEDHANEVPWRSHVPGSNSLTSGSAISQTRRSHRSDSILVPGSAAIDIESRPSHSATHPTQAPPAELTRPSRSRSRRHTSILISRTGLVGQQVALTNAGIDYAASELQRHAVTRSSVGEQRRQLGQVVKNAVAVFSEDRGTPRSWPAIRRERAHIVSTTDNDRGRASRQASSEGHYAPVSISLQARRPMIEIARSRSGPGVICTTASVSQRNITVREEPHMTPNDRVVSTAHPSSFSTILSSTMRSRDSTGAGCAGRPTYAQIAALPVPSEPRRSRHESEQPARSLVTVLRERSSTASFGNLTRRIHPLLASLITPVPRRTLATSQGTPRGAPASGRSSGVADSGNWRARRLSGNAELNTEFAPSPSPAMRPRAQAAAQGSRMRGSMLSVAGRAQLRDLMHQAQGRRDVIASSTSTSNHPMATRKGATIQGGQEDNQRRNGQDANCREAIAPRVRSACGIAPLVLERTTKLGEKASGCGGPLVSGQSTGTEDVFLSATMSSRVLPATSGNLGNSSGGAKAGTRLGDNAVDALLRVLGDDALPCASLAVCSTSGSVEPLASSSSLEAMHQLSAVHAPSSKHEAGLPTTTLSRQGPDVAVPTSISTSSATRSTSASTPSRPRTRTTRASQSPFDRYDPWAFEQQAVDGGVANRGHQATPRGLSRRQRAASILASTEA